jgi:hypothetical protein
MYAEMHTYKMPKNGEINIQFGVYKNVCCGTEIVIPVGSTFPNCARHLDQPTVWEPVSNDDSIPRASELPDSKKRCA